MDTVQATPKVTTELTLVTPAMAQMWLTSNLYERQRPIREAHVDALAYEMEMGRFVQGTQIAFAGVNGDSRLINGQHTLHAIVKSGRPQLLDIAWHKVLFLEEIDHLYYRYDRHKTRTLSDSYNALDLSAKLELTDTQLNKLGAAARSILTDFHVMGGRTKELSVDDIATVIEDYASYAKIYFGWVLNSPQTMTAGLHRSSTLSVALVTIRYATQAMGQDKVREFWHGVAFDDGLRIGDPRKLLSKQLMVVRIRGGERSFPLASNPLVTSKTAAMHYTARCWNAWARGESLRVVHLPAKLGDIEIECTPWSKNWTE